MKSVQISVVAEKFPCCIIMKTLDQRKELFKIRLYRLAFKQHVINSRRTKKGGAGGSGGLYKHVQETELSPVKARPQSDLIKERTQGKKAQSFEFSAADCRKEDNLIQQLVFIGSIVIPLGELTESQQESRVQSLWQQGRNFLWVDFA